MSRDLSNESIFNILLRVFKSLSVRIRGKLYYLFNIFNSNSSSKFTFGKGTRFINSKSITLSKNVHFGINARLECYGKGKISFDMNSSCGDYIHIGSINEVYIGKNVLIGSNVLIIDHSHGKPKEDILNENSLAPRDRKLSTKGPIRIEDDVWISDGVVILSGITIGKGSIIGANTVIRRNIPKNTIYIGDK
ncbi:hypothetical protein HOK00_05300 [bacterium]|jgi:acetyltransferase-like isoleucine patch superfamily enzyme|nr:hypothetical protein [bacterium]